MDVVKKHLCNSILFFILPLSIFLTLNKHSRSRVDSYKSVIWADAAGYYVYLPLCFIYDNDASRLPERIVERTGFGFTVDTLSNTVITKYTSGVALLQFPFFITSHTIAKLLEKPDDGFSSFYQYGIMIAAVFYGCLGLWFLCKFLQINYEPVISFITTLSIFLCTNMYYYTIEACGMSHVYSFFLFAAMLYFSTRYSTRPLVKILFLILFLLAIAVLIRPTNVLFALVLLFYNVVNLEELRIRLQSYIKNKVFFAFALIGSSFIFIPQLIYWYSLSGSFLHYSYGNEGFLNWSNPQLLKLWFSTKNGLFSYAPLILLAIAGMIFMYAKKTKNARLIMLVFISSSYFFASWHDWTFGCSFGSRPFVEYYPLFSIPIAFILSTLKSNYQKVAVYGFILFCCYLNFDMTYYYDGCFYGGEWDFESYLKLLK